MSRQSLTGFIRDAASGSAWRSSVAGPRLAAKLGVFLRLAADLAGLSTCRRLRVGCAVVTPTLSEVLAIGYNGVPSGEPNAGCRGAEGACGCIHADANALVRLAGGGGDLTMVLTCSPCEHCAGLIVNCRRIGAVVWRDEYRDHRGAELVERRGVAAARWSDVAALEGEWR